MELEEKENKTKKIKLDSSIKFRMKAPLFTPKGVFVE
jgi:hypothetical protein